MCVEEAAPAPVWLVEITDGGAEDDDKWVFTGAAQTTPGVLRRTGGIDESEGVETDVGGVVAENDGPAIPAGAIPPPPRSDPIAEEAVPSGEVSLRCSVRCSPVAPSALPLTLAPG